MRDNTRPTPTCNSDELEATEMELAKWIAATMCLCTITKAQGTSLSEEVRNNARANTCLVESAFRKREAQASWGLSYLLASGSEGITQHLVGGRVSDFSREVRMRCGTADFVVEHPNGSYTVIELKRTNSRQEQIAGIGQVLMYTTDLRDMGVTVHPLLVVVGSLDPYTKAASAAAGVPCAALDPEMLESHLRVGALLKGFRGQT